MAIDTPASSIRSVAFASLIGTTIEWYDFFLYGTAAALVFNRLYFPMFDPLAGTLAAFGTYAVGFVARPIGGIVIGMSAQLSTYWIDSKYRIGVALAILIVVILFRPQGILGSTEPEKI